MGVGGMPKWTEVLRGTNGGVEINRLVSFFGGFAYIIGGIGFQWWDMSKGNDFDVTAFCLAFSGGIAAIVTGTGAGVALKDRNVAHSKVVSETGSRPADPPAPAPKVQPELVGDPPPSTEGMPSYAV